MCPKVTLGNVRSVPRQHFCKPPSLIVLGFRDLGATASGIYGGMKKLEDKLIKSVEEQRLPAQIKNVMYSRFTK